ncbi:hypothetical protein ACFPRL_35660 [Pseudoclavibacter helvolus]
MTDRPPSPLPAAAEQHSSRRSRRTVALLRITPVTPCFVVAFCGTFFAWVFGGRQARRSTAFRVKMRSTR